MMRTALRTDAGFTLIEAIVAIVITGILVGAVAVFITKPVEGYADSVRRAELTDAADVALRRMTRDVRLALPNSLRTVTDGFEFVMTKSGGRYRDESDGSTCGNFLYTTDIDCVPPPPPVETASENDFDVLGPMPAITGGDRIVVYNLGAGYAPADVYAGDNVATVAGAVPITVNPVPLVGPNPFPAQTPPLPSPDSRFQVVSSGDLVVRYTCTGGVLTRFSGCSLATPSVCGGTGAVLAGSATTEPKATCDIVYSSGVTGRSGLLLVTLTLTDTPSGEAVTLFQQIHVDNAP
jgi:MSHA biogenesis protein MshO